MRFADLKNRHAGDPIWVIGTGPSLDALDADDVVGPRIYLNRAAFVMSPSRGETYWLVADDCWGNKVPGPWGPHLEDIRAGGCGEIAVLRDPLLTGRSDCPTVPPPTGPNIVTWREDRFKDCLYLNRDELAEAGTLHMWTGTASPAVHLAWFLGAVRVNLVGIDGTRGWAQKLSHLYTNQAAGDGQGYGDSRARALDTARRLRLHIEDRSTPAS